MTRSRPPSNEYRTAAQVVNALKALGDPKIAEHSQRFFKTGKGEYGEGDKFFGVRVPAQRKLARSARGLSLAQMLKLLRSPWHEARLTAVIMLAEAYSRGEGEDKQAIYDAYLQHSAYVNNWDIVDASAHKIVGPHLFGRPPKTLTKLAKSKLLWERRIAMIACKYAIDRDEFDTALKVAECLLNDDEDLIHKAVGWMLREVGNHDPAVERAFLDRHAASMPRTMLRYAIEKFPANERRDYMARN